MKSPPASAPEEVLMTPEEVATRLRLSRDTIMRYYKTGTLQPAVVTPRGTPRFRWPDVVADLEKKRGAQ